MQTSDSDDRLRLVDVSRYEIPAENDMVPWDNERDSAIARDANTHSSPQRLAL
jgi:hypothetical protein